MKKIKSNKIRSCEYFNVYHYEVKNEITMKNTSETIVFITMLEGEGKIIGENSVDVKKGDTILIPAYDGEVKFVGTGEYIYSTL